MATTKLALRPAVFEPAATNGAQWKTVDGTNFPVSGWAFDAATAETIFTILPILNYGSGNITFRIYWYADTATANDTVWGVSLGAITGNVDTQDIETKSLASENTATDSHLGTTGQRLHFVDVTVSNLDSVAADDLIVLRLRRVAADAGDTMAGDALFIGAAVSYSDT